MHMLEPYSFASARSCSRAELVRQRPQDRIQHVIESFSQILGQEPQNKVAVLLEQGVLTVARVLPPPIWPISLVDVLDTILRTLAHQLRTGNCDLATTDSDL